jgi:hypothetical protein
MNDQSGAAPADAVEILCGYSLAHAMGGVPATGVLVCGSVGPVPACDDCQAFYARMSLKR